MIVYSILPVICLIAGFYLGYSLKKDDRLPEIPSPTKIVEKKKEEKREIHEKDILNQYLDNIDNYPNNQKDID